MRSCRYGSGNTVSFKIKAKYSTLATPKSATSFVSSSSYVGQYQVEMPSSKQSNGFNILIIRIRCQVRTLVTINGALNSDFDCHHFKKTISSVVLRSLITD